MQLIKCTSCDAKVTVPMRSSALDAGWTFVTAENQRTLKYHALCPDHASLDWVKKALLDDARKGSK